MTPLWLPLIVLWAACAFIVLGRWTQQNRIGSWLLLAILLGMGAYLYYEMFQVPAPAAALEKDVVIDPLARSLEWLAIGLGLLFAPAVIADARHARSGGQSFGLFLMGVAALMVVGLAGDLILLFLSLELTAVPVYALLWTSQPQPTSREAAVKHLLMGILSGVIVLYGLTLVYGLTGSTELAAVSRAFASGRTAVEPAAASGTAPSLGMTALVLLLAGLGFRMSVAPFHFGMPEIASGGSIWTAGWLAAVHRTAAVVVLVRVAIGGMVGLERTGQLAAMVLAGGTMLVGSAMACVQTEIRRFLAYTLMAHAGFVLMGFAAGFGEGLHQAQPGQHAGSLPGGVSAAMCFLVFELVAVGGLSAALAYLSHPDRRLDFLEDLVGLFRTQPTAAVCICFCLCSLVGIPPFPGFWGRWYVLSACVSVGREPAGSTAAGPNLGMIVLVAIAVAHILLTATTVARICSVIFFDSQRSRPTPAGGRLALLAAVLACAVALAGGLAPGKVLHHLNRVEASLRRERPRVQRDADATAHQQLRLRDVQQQQRTKEVPRAQKRKAATPLGSLPRSHLRPMTDVGIAAHLRASH